MGYALVADRSVTHDGVTDRTRLLQGAGGSDGDETPGAECDEFFQDRRCGRGADAELAHNPDLMTGCGQCDKSSERLALLGSTETFDLQDMVEQTALIAEDDPARHR